MPQNREEMERIRQLLHDSPTGLTITEISTALGMHRNTTAKYLDMLVATGETDRKRMGPARAYFPTRRMPAQALSLVTPPARICLTARLDVAEKTPEAASLLNRPPSKDHIPATEIHTPLFRDETFLTRCKEAVAGIPGAYQTPLTTNTGTGKQTWEIRFIPVIYPDETTGCAATFTPTPTPSAAEEEAKNWKARYTALSRELSEWVVHITPAMTIAFANDAFCRHAGRTADRIKGTRFLPAFRPDERQHLCA